MMDHRPETPAADDVQLLDSPAVEATTAPFVGRWNRLVSQTNWEKGRIIGAWREAMSAGGAAAGSYTDEAWSLRVGGVTPQHVGRLRRVWERFGNTHQQYAGLYWSHFQAALDWDDAEMWLEGASQNRWSISQMRASRAEALGATAELNSREEDVQQAEWDDDAEPSVEGAAPLEAGDSYAPWEDEASDDSSDEGVPFDEQPVETAAASAAAADAAPPVRPFEGLAALPPDLNEAFEAFKLAIIGRRLSGWQDIACSDVLAALEALKQLATAPA